MQLISNLSWAEWFPPWQGSPTRGTGAGRVVPERQVTLILESVCNWPLNNTVLFTHQREQCSISVSINILSPLPFSLSVLYLTLVDVGRWRRGQLIQTVHRLSFPKLCLYPRIKKQGFRKSNLNSSRPSGGFKGWNSVSLWTACPYFLTTMKRKVDLIGNYYNGRKPPHWR